jgi:epoxyqueuosine reductase QueG
MNNSAVSIVKIERDENLTKRIKKYCKKIGVDVIGFADPKLFDRFPEYNRPQAYLKDCNTVIIIGFHLYDLTLDAWNSFQEQNRSYQFADSIIENFCNKVSLFLKKKGHDSTVITYEPGLFLKDASVLAGIGPIGKNNLLITPTYGSQVRLRALATNAPLICGDPFIESEYCKNCNKCIESCPSNAFVDGKFTKSICYDYSKSNLNKLSDQTAIWCNVCIEACPVGKKVINNE